MQRIVALLLLGSLVGCSDPGEPSIETTTKHSALAVSGPWQIPTQVEATASNHQISYVGAGRWVGPSGCSGTFTDGAAALRSWVLENWPQVTQIGGYSCRAIVGNSSSMSVHGTGRAIDIHIPLDGGQADNGLGDPLANWLVENAEEIGIQMVIWDRWLWSPSRTPYSRYYGGEHPHHDHLHVELTPAAGRMETPWFAGGMGSPGATLPPCDASISADGGIVDETSNCFTAYGPNQYWRRVDGEGINGSLLWTNAFESSSPSNWARWRLNFEESGRYVLDYHNSASYGLYDSATYRVKTATGEEEVTLDQSRDASGWNEIGTFEFSADMDHWISLFDNASFDVGTEQHIVFDAIRVRREGTPAPGGDPLPGDDDADVVTGGTGDDGDATGGGDSTPGTGSTPPIGATSDPPPKTPDYQGSQPGEVFDEPAEGDHGHGFDDPVHASGKVHCSSAAGSPAGPLLLLFAVVAARARRRRG